MLNKILDEIAKELKDLYALIKCKNEYRAELQKIENLISDIYMPIKNDIYMPIDIMVIGKFSTGKSTFINALLGENLLKMEETPTTAMITKICYGEKDIIKVVFDDNTEKICSQKEFDILTVTEGEKEKNSYKNIKYIERQLPCEQLKKFTVIDSPGLDAYRKDDEKITRNFIKNVDTLILLFDINQMNSFMENELLNNLDERLKPIGIINKIDTYDEDEEDESLEDFIKGYKVLLQDKLFDLIGISARQALEGKLNKNDSLIKESNIDAVVNVINNIVLKNKDTYKIYSLLDSISIIFMQFGYLIDNLIEENKHLANENYERYVKKRIEILEVFDKLSNVARPIYNYSQTCKSNSSYKLFIGILYYYGILLSKNLKEAIKYIECSAMKNNQNAQEFLLNYYLKKDNDEKIFYWSEKLVKNNNAFAQYILGKCYYHGIGVEKNSEEAVKWYKKASDQGIVEAQYTIAKCYEKGIGVVQNLEKAIILYEKAADQGVVEAQYKLARYYEKGIGVVQNLEKAIILYEKAANQGIAEAQYKLAKYYEDGIGVVQNLRKAIVLYLEAADQGVAEAQYKVALYQNNIEKKLELLTKAANKGLAEAQVDLGIYYEQGKDVIKDLNKAIILYEKAANQGYMWGQFHLAVCYENGQGISQNKGRAFYWCEKAANQGLVEAQTYLGLYYKYGIGIEPNKKKAIEYFKKATEKNYAWAQYYLAIEYKDSTNSAEVNKRRELFQASAEKDIADAQYELALEYKNDNRKSFYWFYRAAQNNQAEAQYRLSLCYEKGIGTQKSKEEAFFWMKQSANNNFIEAKNVLEQRYR